MNQGIYKIINVVNNKFYIGSAVDLKRRRIRHFSELRVNKHNNKHLQAAWNKYGEAAFTFAVIELVSDKAKLLATEDKWLKKYVGKEYCYNIGITASAPSLGMCGELSPTWGYKHTEEAKAKIAKASKERVQTPEEKEKRRLSMVGRVVSPEHKAKISNTLSGEGNYWYGKKRPEHGGKVSKKVFAMPDGIMFASLKEALEYYDIKMPTLRRALKAGTSITKGKLTGYTFKYVGQFATQTPTDIALINAKKSNKLIKM